MNIDFDSRQAESFFIYKTTNLFLLEIARQKNNENLFLATTDPIVTSYREDNLYNERLRAYKIVCNLKGK